LIPNLLRRAAFVLAVCPLPDIRVELQPPSKAGEPTRFLGALHRTRQYEREVPGRELLPELSRLLATALGQWDVGEARVLTRQCPFSFAVAHEHDLMRRRLVRGCIHRVRPRRRMEIARYHLERARHVTRRRNCPALGNRIYPAGSSGQPG